MRGARIVAPLAACGVVVAGLLPWTVSGQAERNAFATVRSARLLELAGEGAGNVVLGLWFFVPVVVGVGLLAVALHRQRLAAVSFVITGAAAVALSAAVVAAPVGRGAGTLAGGVLGLLAVLSGGAIIARPLTAPAR